jgi:catechol 2,3-dioxygenase-like lactoylglutathione lyase family enzyme/GNAT superfamily N-acetyltransferase
MIQSLYETHLTVRDMPRALEFYDRLGLELADVNAEGTVAFYWIGKPKAQMLGLWLASEERPFVQGHFAFEVDREGLSRAREWLAARGISPAAAFGRAPTEPVVHTWMPAASLYFDDPDGNVLEFITVLPDEPLPGGLRSGTGVVYLSEWERLQKERSGSESGDARGFQIEPLSEECRDRANRLLVEGWGTTLVATRGRLVDAAVLPGFVATQGRQDLGLVTYEITGDACEIVTLHSVVEGIGVGAALIAAVAKVAAASACRRLWLITTNDNCKALRFYQRRGFQVVAVHPNALEHSRRLKPQIPLLGLDGIPLRDEIELELPREAWSRVPRGTGESPPSA